MDPNIMKLLEEDDDDTMHSGADVEAFSASLSRDIEGDSNYSQTPDADRVSTHGNNSTPPLQQRTENNHPQSSENAGIPVSKQNAVNNREQDKTQHQNNKQQCSSLQKMNNPQPSASVPNASVTIKTLLQVMMPQLDKDKVMQLELMYEKIRRNGIDGDGCIRIMRSIVGDSMVVQALNHVKMLQTKAQAARESQTGAQQYQEQPQTSQPQQIKMPPMSASQLINSRSFSQPLQKGQMPSNDPAQVHTTTVQVQNDPSFSTTMKQETELSTLPSQGLKKPAMANLPQKSYPMYGVTLANSHAHAYSGPSISATASLKSTQDSQMRQAQLHQNMFSSQPGGTTLQLSNEKKHSSGPSMPYVKQEILDPSQERQHKSHISTSSSSTAFTSGQADKGKPALSQAVKASSSLAIVSDSVLATRTEGLSNITPTGHGTNVKIDSKEPSVGQKKPIDAPAPTPTPSKKQKVSGAFQDQSIDQLNDVTAGSGIDLGEEEEQLLSGPKHESRVSEATRRVVQEEEERLILQKAPLQKRMAEIMSKYGIKHVSNDLERCLSLCVEERMRGLISSLIRISKQRADIERSRHRTLITSDVWRQILLMNRKIKENWEKKQAEETEKVQKLNEADGTNATGGEREKDEGRAKNLKEDYKTRTKAANNAAREAVGGDDMLSKWQILADNARQKREGRADMVSPSQLSSDVGRRASSTCGGSTRVNQDTDNRGTSSSSGVAGRKFGRNPVTIPHKIARTVSVEDVITVLERESQMSKSTLVYRLYERMRSGGDATPEQSWGECR